MAKTRHPSLPFVCVIWDDAVSRDAEVDLEDVENELTRFQTYGWLAKQGPKAVTVVSDFRPSDSKYRDRTTIPVGGIVEIITLQLAIPRVNRKKGAAATADAGAAVIVMSEEKPDGVPA